VRPTWCEGINYVWFVFSTPAAPQLKLNELLHKLLGRNSPTESVMEAGASKHVLLTLRRRLNIGMRA